MNITDITDTLAPKSDQLDAVDLLGGPRVFTVERVTAGNSEQPVQVHLAEFPRPWRPGKSMRRVLAFCWGAEASQWTGRRLRLWCDPNVKFGGEAVGGVRILALSHTFRRSAQGQLIEAMGCILTGRKSGWWPHDNQPTIPTPGAVS